MSRGHKQNYDLWSISIPHALMGILYMFLYFVKNTLFNISEHFIVLKLQIFVKLGNRFVCYPRHYILK